MRQKCDYCAREATRYTRGHNLCELHYAQVDVSKAEEATYGMREFPPYRVAERLRLLEVLEGMLGADWVCSELCHEKWYQKIRVVPEDDFLDETEY